MPHAEDATVTGAALHGVTMRFGDADVYTPAFEHGYGDPELAALTNLVIG